METNDERMLRQVRERYGAWKAAAAYSESNEITIRLCDMGQATLVICESSRLSDGINKESFRVDETCR